MADEEKTAMVDARLDRKSTWSRTRPFGLSIGFAAARLCVLTLLILPATSNDRAMAQDTDPVVRTKYFIRGADREDSPGVIDWMSFRAELCVPEGAVEEERGPAP